MNPSNTTPQVHTIRLDLPDFDWSMLEYLFDRLPTKTQEEIIYGAFARGLASLFTEELEKEGDDDTTVNSRDFPRRLRVNLTPAQQSGLCNLSELLPDSSDDELLHEVLTRGIPAACDEFALDESTLEKSATHGRRAFRARMLKALLGH
jgi:hypothetical protein